MKKKTTYGTILLGATVLLTGCAGFWNPPSSTSTTTTTTTLSSGYFYVLDQSTAQVISYYIDAGTLTLVNSAAVPETPIAITVAPNDQFLYVSTLDGIYLYAISGGELTLGNSSQAITSDPAVAMQVDSTDAWLVETSGTGTLNAVPIINTTGLLNSGVTSCSGSICTVPLTGSAINQLAIAPNNEYVFVAAGTNGTEAFGFTAGNTNPFQSAAYTTVSGITSGTSAALCVAVDPSDRLLYIGETDDRTSSGGGLRVFTIGASGGALTEISGSPYDSGGSGPHAILPKNTNDYVYVANWNGTSSGNITGFSITASGSTFSITNINNSVGTGVEPIGLVEDSSHDFVLAASAGGSPDLDGYFFDATTAGQLDTTITSSSYTPYALAANH